MPYGHWAGLNSVQNFLIYLKIVTKLKKTVISHIIVSMALIVGSHLNIDLLIY